MHKSEKVSNNHNQNIRDDYGIRTINKDPG